MVKPRSANTSSPGNDFVQIPHSLSDTLPLAQMTQFLGGVIPIKYLKVLCDLCIYQVCDLANTLDALSINTLVQSTITTVFLNFSAFWQLLGRPMDEKI